MLNTMTNPDSGKWTWPNYTFEAALAASEKVNWQVEDLIGGDKRLDFTRRFLPESRPGWSRWTSSPRTRSGS